MAPHSSASTWPKPIQRSRLSGMTRPIASDTALNRWRMPVWNSNGSSASRRNWLNVNPAGSAISGTKVEIR